MSDQGGTKNDGGKARHDLIPAEPLDQLAKLYGLGAAKYGERNWERGLNFGRVFAAMLRHAWAWWRGERYDPEDGQHHLASVAWNAFALMQLEETHPGLDTRPNMLVNLCGSKAGVKVGDEYVPHVCVLAKGHDGGHLWREA